MVRLRFVIILAIASASLNACNKGQAISATPSPTSSITPTPTKPATATPRPTTTLIPTATATPKRLGYVAIEPSNLDGLALIKNLGLGGKPVWIGYTNDGKQIRIITETRSCLIDGSDFRRLHCSDFPQELPWDFIKNMSVNYSYFQYNYKRGQGTSVSFVQDASILAFADGEVWDVSKMQLISKSAAGIAATLSPDGTYKAICSPAGTGKQGHTELNDTHTNATLQDFEGYCFASALATQPRPFSPDNQRLILLKENTARVWDIASGQFVQEYPLDNALSRADFSPKGDYLALTTRNSIFVYRTDDQKLVFQYAAPGFIWDYTFSRDEQYLAIAVDSDTSIRVWNVVDWSEKNIYSTGAPAKPDAIRFSPNSKYLYAHDLESNKYALWDVQTGDLKWLLAGANEIAFSTISQDEKQFLYLTDFEYTVMDVESGEKISAHPIELGSVFTVSPDGNSIASGTLGGTIALWNTTDGGLIRIIGDTDEKKIDLSSAFQVPVRTRAIAFSPDGQMIASGTDDGQVRLWNVSDGELIKTLLTKNDFSDVVLAFSPNGRTLAANSLAFPNDQKNHRSTRVWSIPDGRLLLQDENDGSYRFEQVWFSPDGQYLGLHLENVQMEYQYKIFELDGCLENQNAPQAGPGCSPYNGEQPAGLSLGTETLKIQKCTHSTGAEAELKKVVSAPDYAIIAMVFTCGTQLYDRQSGAMIGSSLPVFNDLAWAPDKTFWIVPTSSGYGIRVWGIK